MLDLTLKYRVTTFSSIKSLAGLFKNTPNLRVLAFNKENFPPCNATAVTDLGFSMVSNDISETPHT